MNSKIRIWVGAISVVIFSVVGATLFTEDQTVLGGVLMAMAGFRAIVLVKQAKSQS